MTVNADGNASADDNAAVPTVYCRRCEADVPAGNFCGLCGFDPTADAAAPLETAKPGWVRPRTFGAAPSEQVLLPYFASSLFPHLPKRSRRPFQVTLLVAMIALAASVAAKVPAAGIAISTLGLPMLFVLYVRSSSLDRDIDRGSLIFAGVLGAILGAGWVLLTGGLLAHTYNVSIGVGLALRHVGQGVGIPPAGMLMMLAPALVLRLRGPKTREALDGFTIGTLAALMFTAGASLARFAPQFAAGLFAHARPLSGLIVEVLMTGVTIPVTGAAAGGLFGILLWFKPAHDHDRRVRLILGLLALAVLLIHTTVGLVDLIGLPQMVMLTIHLASTALALIALRLALQLALLHETHDPIRQDEPLLCVHCEMVVPDMAFCPACGAATRASTRTSRTECRAVRPEQEPIAEHDERNYPGYALPQGQYCAPTIVRPRFGWLVSRWGTVVTAFVAALAGVALALTPKIAHYMCPPECGRPPAGMPVMGLPKFTAPDGKFSVSYPSPGSAYQVNTYDNGVVANYLGGDTGVMQLFSQPANGRSARDIVQATLRKRYPDAKVAYEIPNAMVGYEPGYGVLADDWPQNPAASYTRQRILVMASVKDDLALTAFAAGPYRAFGPDSGPGLPSGANLEIAQDLGKYVNSFQWGSGMG